MEPCLQYLSSFRWVTSDYGDCSRTCDGRQSRMVYCQCTATGGSAADGSAASGSATGGSAIDGSATGGFTIDASGDKCKRDDIRLRPVLTRRCGEECADYTWFEGPWGLCSKACATGSQTRSVYCRKQTVKSDKSTADSNCEAIGPKPVIQRDCDFDCQYVLGRWGNCSVSCGGGTQNRFVDCRQTDEQKRTRTVMLQNCEEEASLGFRPRATRPCYTEPCAVVEGTCRHIYCHGLHGALSAIFVVF